MKLVRWLMSVCVCVTVSARDAQSAEAEAPPVSGSGAPTAGAEESTTPEKSPWGWLAMPKVTMPKIEMPKLPADPLAPVKAGAKKVSDGANKAWEGTKEIFTFGPAKTTSADPKTPETKSPSIWSKMFGGEKKEEPQGPQTVAEFMAQKRLDP